MADELLFEILSSPISHLPLHRDGFLVRTEDGSQTFQWKHGFLDFAPDILSSAGLSQKVMEWKPVQSIYEDAFRSLFTKLGSTITYQQESAFLHRWQASAQGWVLDLACGSGRYLREWLKEDGGVKGLGLDLSAGMLTQASRKLGKPLAGRVALARASAESLPLADGVLGGLNCFGALHLFPNPDLALKEAGRVLKTGSVLTLLTAFQSTSWQRQAQGLFSKTADFRFFEETEMERMLGEAGLKFLALERHGMVGLVAAGKI